MPLDIQPLRKDPSVNNSSGSHKDRESITLLDTIPPAGLVLFSVISIQVGTAIAKHLFPILGAQGTVAMRIIISALLLVAAARGRVKTFSRIFATNWGILLMFGISLAAMNFLFYMAIARIQLGAAVAIEFIGPLGVAVFSSRRISHLAWVALAAMGIVLLSPLSGIDLDTLGILFALLAGIGWASFIILAARLGESVSGNDGLTIGMVIAAFIMTPFALPILPDLIFDPLILLASFGVALLSTTVPLTLEYAALKRIPKRTYGVLVSVEPAVAALVGVLLLGEYLGLQGVIAIGCVVIAAIGITVSDGQNPL
jgi:inner membrane transporter RhtA